MRFDEVAEGDEITPHDLRHSKDAVRAYARACDIYFPRFTDDEGARREGLPEMITPGNMSMGLLSAYLERWAGIGALRRLGTTFRGLVLADRTIRLCGVVTERDESARTVEVDVWIESDEGERLVIGTATLQLA
ncbi:MAG TPA: MaoC/PaaZ C-terminal domain-containing protein [Candidatus Eisenbacteria bacterium]|nr:MaoC/PaaZ C-terminal domain-containing protein [Candidatus Eisenbacteria bacterium]